MFSNLFFYQTSFVILSAFNRTRISNRKLHLKMDLAFNLLLTLLLEIPFVGFFFRRKKRKYAYLVALLTNIITWVIMNILRLNTDISVYITLLLVMVAEAIAYWIFLECGGKKAFLISIIANLLSFVVTKYVYISPDFIQNKQEIIVSLLY